MTHSSLRLLRSGAVATLLALAASLLMAVPASAAPPASFTRFDWESKSTIASTRGFTYFVADDGRRGSEVWRTNGTKSGTNLVKDLSPGATSAGVLSISATASGVFIRTAGSATTPPAIWWTDTLRAPQRVAAGLATIDTTYTDGTYFYAVGQTADQLANHSTTRSTVYRFGAAGTVSSRTIPRTVRIVGVARGAMFFVAAASEAPADSFNYELWRTPFGGGEPALVRDLVPGPNGSTIETVVDPQAGVSTGSNVYFTAWSGPRRDLWTSDGTSAGTKRIHSLTIQYGVIAQLRATGSGIVYEYGTSAFTGWQSTGGASVKRWSTPAGTFTGFASATSAGQAVFAKRRGTAAPRWVFLNGSKVATKASPGIPQTSNVTNDAVTGSTAWITVTTPAGKTRIVRSNHTASGTGLTPVRPASKAYAVLPGSRGLAWIERNTKGRFVIKFGSNKYQTATTVKLAKSKVAYRKSGIVATAKVAMGSGGTVSFYINGKFHKKVALNSQRTAKVRLPAKLAKRTHTITAKYSGTTSRTGSKGSAKLRVG